MSDNPRVFPVPESWKGKAWIDEDDYRRAYDRSLRDPDDFWAEQALADPGVVARIVRERQAGQ